MGLVERVTDKVGVPQYKCLLLYEDIGYLAKKLDMDVKISELMWHEP